MYWVLPTTDVHSSTRFCENHLKTVSEILFTDRQTLGQTDRKIQRDRQPDRLRRLYNLLKPLNICGSLVRYTYLKGIIIFIHARWIADSSPCCSAWIKRIDDHLFRALDLSSTERTALSIRILAVQTHHIETAIDNSLAHSMWKLGQSQTTDGPSILRRAMLSASITVVHRNGWPPPHTIDQPW